MHRVVVTGAGVVAPNGLSVEEFSANLFAGGNFIKEAPKNGFEDLKFTSYAPITNFSDEAVESSYLASLSRFVKISVSAMNAAAQGALLTQISDKTSYRKGVFFSSAVGGTPEFQRFYEISSNHGEKIPSVVDQINFYDSVFLNYPPNYIADKFNFNGPVTTLTTGCTAGLDSFGMAYDMIKHGELDLVIASAGEAPISGLAYSTLDAIGSLAVCPECPEKASRPFDLNRNGFVLGEGAAAFVLENLESAIERGANILAEVEGFSTANNAYHMSDLQPDSLSMVRVIEDALYDASVSTQEIDYINAHGSSTFQNDLFEANSFKKVFGDTLKRIHISSTKGAIGHSLSSTSLIGVLTAIVAIREKNSPPTINLEILDSSCDLRYSLSKYSREKIINHALVCASGFGGIHSAAVVSRI